MAAKHARVMRRAGMTISFFQGAPHTLHLPGPEPQAQTMQCEIISVGSELTSGQNLDTNSQWLSRRLAEVGIPVGWHTTIADDLAANVDAFRIACGRARLVLITGGARPPPDAPPPAGPPPAPPAPPALPAEARPPT